MALELESSILNSYPNLAQGLIAAGVESDRRTLRVKVNDLNWQFIQEDILELGFTLPAGSYATSVLREIINL